MPAVGGLAELRTRWRAVIFVEAVYMDLPPQVSESTLRVCVVRPGVCRRASASCNVQIHAWNHARLHAQMREAYLQTPPVMRAQQTRQKLPDGAEAPIFRDIADAQAPVRRLPVEQV